jgi:hypothetical protein
MTTTTSYGSFHNHAESPSVEQYVDEAFGSEGPDGFNTAGIVSEFRNAINDALPPSVSLCGNEFYGPYYAADKDFDGYQLTEDGDLDITGIIEDIDFWAIAARHDLATHAELAKSATDYLDELADKDDRHGLILCPDDVENDTWNPVVYVINLDDPESTDQPYVLLLDHDDFTYDEDASSDTYGEVTNMDAVKESCKTIDWADAMRRVEEQIVELGRRQ